MPHLSREFPASTTRIIGSPDGSFPGIHNHLALRRVHAQTPVEADTAGHAAYRRCVAEHFNGLVPERIVTAPRRHDIAVAALLEYGKQPLHLLQHGREQLLASRPDTGL